MIIAFVEGVFANCSVIIAWQEIFQFSLDLKCFCIEKDKSPLNSNSLYVFKNNSLTFDQINFCTISDRPACVHRTVRCSLQRLLLLDSRPVLWAFD